MPHYAHLADIVQKVGILNQIDPEPERHRVALPDVPNGWVLDSHLCGHRVKVVVKAFHLVRGRRVEYAYVRTRVPAGGGVDGGDGRV